MTKEECLLLLKLLAAVESWATFKDLPDYMYPHIDAAVLILEREILK